MTPRTIDQLLRDFRGTLLRIDQRLANQLVQAHASEVQRLEAAMRDLETALRVAGTIDDAERWARDVQAARVLIDAARAGMADFGEYAATQISERIAELTKLSALHDEKLTYASLVGNEQVTPATSNAIRAAFTAIPVETVSFAVGALQPLSPLRALFDTFGTDASRKLGEALVGGITRGEGAAQIGRAMRESLNDNAARALTIARTETHRAYRSSSLDRYRANTRVYAGWQWSANLDRRTCPVCIVKHGSEHKLDEEFGSHPNCRCRPIPITRNLSDILGRSNPEIEQLDRRMGGPVFEPNAGDAWFKGLDADAQREILGPLKYDAWRGARFSLEDVVVERVDPVWGLGHRTASLREAVANANARRSL